MAEIETSNNVDSPAEPNKICKTPPLWGSARFTYTICAFFAMLFHLCMRNILNFAVLCMVKPQQENPLFKYNSTDDLNACSQQNAGNDSTGAKTGDLMWTRSQEFVLAGSFYYGFIFVQPIAGRLADKFGGKVFFVNSLTVQALVFMFMPFIARKSYEGVVTLRAVQGLIAAFGSPALYQLFSTWAHPSERTVFLSIAYMGFSAGSVLVFPISSFLCTFGWEFVFYAVGSVSLVFGVCCQWLVYSNLDDHPRLSKAEYDYLKSNRAEILATGIPWKSILTSLPVNAFIVTHFCHSYGDFIFTLLIPRFFKEAMHLPLDAVGLLSSAPYLGAFISKAVSIATCSIMEKQQNLNLAVLRRIAYVVYNFITIMLIFGMILYSCKDRLTVVMFAISIGFTIDMGFSGIYWPSLLHLAPALAGFLSGIANCLATTNGFLAPLAISIIVRQGNKDEWDVVLASLMISFSISAIVYGLFGSSKLAKWGEMKTMEDNKITAQESKEIQNI